MKSHCAVQRKCIDHVEHSQQLVLELLRSIQKGQQNGTDSIGCNPDGCCEVVQNTVHIVIPKVIKDTEKEEVVCFDA